MAEKLKIIPLGGLNEIGKNMTVLEYGKDIIIVDCGLGFPDEETRKQFCAEQASRLAKDSEGNTCYMATSIYNLQTTMKHWPQVQFRTTREQGQKFD